MRGRTTSCGQTCPQTWVGLAVESLSKISQGCVVVNVPRDVRECDNLTDVLARSVQVTYLKSRIGIREEHSRWTLIMHRQLRMNWKDALLLTPGSIKCPHAFASTLPKLLDEPGIGDDTSSSTKLYRIKISPQRSCDCITPLCLQYQRPFLTSKPSQT